MIAEGGGFSPFRKMDQQTESEEFEREELGNQAAWFSEILSSFELMQCDSLIFRVDIKVDNDQDDVRDEKTIDYWTKLRMNQAGDERKEISMKSNNISSIHDRLESTMESQIAKMFTMISKNAKDIAAMNQRLMRLQSDRKIDRMSPNVDTERMEFKKWMENTVRLPEYFELLIENGFEDMESMKDMTMEHLREMGIDKMGHRIKLMKGIAALKAVDE